jgi:hypothetical protein
MNEQGKISIAFDGQPSAEASTSGQQAAQLIAKVQPKLWCLFTSAGDRNAIRSWLKGETPRRWDLVVAYYGDSEDEFAKLNEVSSYAFRVKGSKFQNIKKLVVEKPNFFDRYSHICVCDDDIRMSTEQIEEAFAIAEALDFWIAQPAHPYRGGKISHGITRSAWPLCDYRIVNFVEVTMPIFRYDKFAEFIKDYDGSLVGWGIDHWYSNLFRANDFGRFAVIDKVRVVNPLDEEKGGREIDQLQPAALRAASWDELRRKRGFTEHPYKVFAYGRLASKRGTLVLKVLQRLFSFLGLQ